MELSEIKAKFYIFIIFIVFVTNAYSQDSEPGKYRLICYNEYVKNTQNNLCTKEHNKSFIKIFIIYKNGEESIYYADYEKLPNKGGTVQLGEDGYILDQYYKDLNNLPQSIRISSSRATSPWIGCPIEAHGIENIDLGNCVVVCDDYAHGFDAIFSISFLPDLTINSNSQELPFDDKITLKAPTGYDNDVYNWEYSFDNETFYSYSKRNKVDNIVISGSDLFKQFNSNITNVYFRLNSGCNTGDVMTLSNVPSAPHIQSYKVEQPHCDGDSNGKIVLKLDRKLYAGEKVYLHSCLVDKDLVDKENWPPGDKIDSITTTNIDSFVIDGVSKGNYYYMLEGTYKGRTCYNMGEKHRAEVKISKPYAFTFTNYFYASTQSISCHGGGDGSMNLNINGGTPPFKYSWKHENETEWSDITSNNSYFTINNLSAGKYQFNVSDRYGCGQSGAIKNFTMTEPEKITTSAGTSRNVTEYGVADGSINYTITMSNNNNGRKYDYRWENSKHEILTPEVAMYGGYTGTKLYNLPADTFLLTVSITQSGTNKPIPPYTTPDGAGCQSIFKVVITQPDPIVIDIDTLKWVSCAGGSDGQLNAHVTGGVKPYTFKWENEKSVAICSDSTLTGSVGKYTLHFTDANGIKRETSAYLPQIDSLKTILENVTKVFCKGNATGEVAIAVKGGTQPYSFLWSSGEQTQNITRKTAGDYEVTVSDANHCKDTLDVTIESSDAISYDLTTKDLTCYHSNDGEIAVSNVAGGNPPYAISWSNGEKDYTLSRLPADSYKGAIIDSRNCIEAIDVMLSEPDTIIPRIEKDIYTMCKGQEQPLDIAIANAKSYAWYNGEVKISDNQQIVVTEAGDYRAEITDNDNCFGQKNFEVRTTDNEIFADFIVASSVAQDSVLRAVNITRSDFETMEWLLDDDSDIWVSEDNPYSLEVAFARQDTFNITLRTSQWGCEAITTKSIVVVDASELEEYEEGDVAYIRKFLVTPNPTDGEFDATIELGEAMDVTLYMYTANSHLPLEERHLTGAKWYKEHFSVSLVSGTYFLRLVTPNPRIYSVAKIVVK